MASILVAHPDPRIADHFASATKAWGYRTRRTTDMSLVVANAGAHGADIVIIGHSTTADTVSCIVELKDSLRVRIVGIGADPSDHDQLHTAGASLCVEPDVGRWRLKRAIAVLLEANDRMYQRIKNPDVHIGAFTHDSIARIAFVNGIPKCLTRIENQLLRALAAHPGEVVRHFRLVHAAWPKRDQLFVERGRLRLHIHNLRRKLEALGPDAPTIELSAANGYRLVPSRPGKASRSAA